jgi:hypothetical protein
MRFKSGLKYAAGALLCLAAFQNCGGFETGSDTQRSLSSPGFPDPASVAVPQSCSFNGQPVADGGAVAAFQNSTVPFGQACVSESRSCANGQLSGSFAFASCAPGQPASCLFNGQTLAHGASVTAYAVSTVPFGQNCAAQAETRTCNNGQLSGTYTFAACGVNQPAACMFNGQTIAHNASVTAYAVSTVPFGQSCAPQAQSRTCNNGMLSGSYTFASCTVNQPAACMFNGQTVAHGANVTAYAVSQVAYGQTCASQAQTRTCSNGSLSGSYANPSCAPAPHPTCALTLANGTNNPWVYSSGAATANYSQAFTTPAQCAQWCESQNAEWCQFFAGNFYQCSAYLTRASYVFYTYPAPAGSPYSFYSSGCR